MVNSGDLVEGERPMEGERPASRLYPMEGEAPAEPSGSDGGRGSARAGY